jgi:hypothetical protein
LRKRDNGGALVGVEIAILRGGGASLRLGDGDTGSHDEILYLATEVGPEGSAQEEGGEEDAS